jgi:drug/metabolite transporter (DMT)-like permease
LVTIALATFLNTSSIEIDLRILLFSGLAGLFSAIALGSLYRAMAIAPVFIVAPIAAAGTLLPILFGWIMGENPTALQYTGLALGLIAITIVSLESNENSNWDALKKGAGSALVCALSIGIFFISFDIATDQNPWWGTFMTRIFSVLFIILVIAFRRHSVHCKPREIPWLIAIGVLDMIAETLYALASVTGLLATVTVTASMWPVTTVLLGYIILREKMTSTQKVSVLFAFSSIGIIAAS